MLKTNLAEIREEQMAKLPLSNEFFDSLRASYGEFDEWFLKKAKKGEKAWVKFDEFGNLVAFLFLQLKTENELDITNPVPGIRKLKISTFKINDSETTAGKRISETFMSIIFDFAIENSVDSIYVTLFKNQDFIKSLYQVLKTWGFNDFSEKRTKNGTETVLVKNVSFKNTPNLKKDYPFYSQEKYQNSNFFCVPFEVRYHDQLFPNNSLKNTPNQSRKFNISSYSITKTYISSISFQEMKTGDFILEYRKKDDLTGRKGCITGIGILLERNADFKSFDEFKNKVGNTSIYEDEELKKIFEIDQNKWEKRTNVLKFLHIYSLGEGKNIWYNDFQPFLDNTNSYPMAYPLKEKNKILELLENKGFKII